MGQRALILTNERVRGDGTGMRLGDCRPKGTASTRPQHRLPALTLQAAPEDAALAEMLNSSNRLIFLHPIRKSYRSDNENPFDYMVGPFAYSRPSMRLTVCFPSDWTKFTLRFGFCTRRIWVFETQVQEERESP